MKKIIAVGFVSLFLAACGSNSNEAPVVPAAPEAPPADAAVVADAPAVATAEASAKVQE